MNLKPLNDPALEQYYQALFAMYGTPGWKELLEDVKVMKDRYNQIRTLTADDLRFRQGQLDILDWMGSHQSITETAYATLVEEQEGEAETPTGGVAKIVSDSAAPQ